MLSGMRTVVEAITSQPGGPAGLTIAGSGQTLPWHAVHERARRLAEVLAQQGIGPGSRVGLLGDTSAGLVTAIQAVWLRGAAFTVLPLPGRAGQPARLAHLLAICADANFDLLIVDEKSCDAGAALSATMRVGSLSALETQADQATPASPILPRLGDLAVLQYTSGSTRTPSAVAVTHGNLAANLDAIEAAIGSSTLDPATAQWLSWLPLYHDMGLIGFLALPMSRGCPLVLQTPLSFALRPASWLANISTYGATVTGAPNFAYALMTALLERPADLRTVRYMFSGGEPIDAAMMARFAAAASRHGLDPDALVASYGLAESTLAVSFSAIGTGITVDEVDRDALERDNLAIPAVAGLPSRRLVRLGPGVRRTQIRIVDETTGLELAPRTVGHIEVSGPSVVGESWLRTGDLGYLADGALVVCGRAKDVLFAAGRNVYPQDVEAAAEQVPGVRAGGAAAFGLAAEGGDRLVVAVECRAPQRFDPAILCRAITEETGMAPADVVILRPGRLPKTSSGKLRRAETRRRYLAGEFITPAAEPPVKPAEPLAERSVQ